MVSAPQNYLAVIKVVGIGGGGVNAVNRMIDAGLKGVEFIPNDRLLQVADDKTSVLQAFRMADEVLLQGVQGITDLITTPGLINLDFADVKMVMSNAGSALMGIGHGTGEERAVAAARKAI